MRRYISPRTTDGAERFVVIAEGLKFFSDGFGSGQEKPTSISAVLGKAVPEIGIKGVTALRLFPAFIRKASSKELVRATNEFLRQTRPGQTASRQKTLDREFGGG
jgi:hypothetical protein